MIAAFGSGKSVIPWYLAGVVPKTDCIAAYKATGAASYAASKVNLVTPGTYDLADGAAFPTWTADTGWLFSTALTQSLTTGIIPATGGSMLIKFACTSPTGGFWLCGVDIAGNAKFYMANNYSGADRAYGSGGLRSIAGAVNAGSMAILGLQGYLNGVSDGAPTAAWDIPQTNEIGIGCLIDAAGAPSQYYSGYILGMAIYNTVLTEVQLLAVIGALNKDDGYYFKSGVTAPSGERYLIMLPDDYNAVAGAPLILMHHGSGDTEINIFNDVEKKACVDALLAAGYILASSHAVANNWGNDAGVAAMEELYAYCDATYNITRVCGWSESMGGLTGLKAVADGTTPYKGWLGSYPACDLAWCYGAGGFNAAIDTAYDIPGGGTYAVQTAGHDPVLLNPALFAGIRMRFYASAADGVITKAANSDAMAALVTGSATECDVVVCTGNHGDASHFLPADYVSFFNRCI